MVGLLPSTLTHKTGGGGGGYTANALFFSGGGFTGNYLSSAAMTGVVAGRTGSLSFWVRFDAGNGVQTQPMGNLPVFFIRNSSNRAAFVTYAANLIDFVEVDSAGGDVIGTSWNHFLLSWDSNHGAGSKIYNMYMNDVSIASVVTDSSGAFMIDYSAFGVQFPYQNNSQSISMAEIWYAPNQFIDFTNPTNRALFSSGGSPISLGTDGSLPTGTSPAVYLRNPAATASINSGTGGNFTVNGVITDTTPP